MNSSAQQSPGLVRDTGAKSVGITGLIGDWLGLLINIGEGSGTVGDTGRTNS